MRIATGKPGASRRRHWLYGGAVAVLGALNLWYWLGTRTEEMSIATPVSEAPTQAADRLEVARELADVAPPLGRDLFRLAPPPVLEVVTPEPAPPPPEPPPMSAQDRLRAAAHAQLVAIRLLGVMGSAGGKVALVSRDGQTVTVGIGGALGADLVVEKISAGGMNVLSKRAELRAAYSLDSDGAAVVSGSIE